MLELFQNKQITSYKVSQKWQVGVPKSYLSMYLLKTFSNGTFCVCCTTALLHISDEILGAIDNGGYTLLVLLEF